jgi:hypothetical protein
MRNLVFGLFALSIAGCGDPLFFAEVEEKRICLQLEGQQVDAAPAAAAGQSVTVEWHGDFDLGSHIAGLDTNRQGTTGDIEMLSLDVTSDPAILQDIHAAEVNVSDASGNFDPDPLMHYTQPSPFDLAATKITFVLDRNLNLFDRLDGGKLHYALQFTGNPPTQPWTATIDTCFRARIMVDALKAMKN